MLVFHPEPHLQLVTGFVGRISDHGCHTQIPERVTVVLADEGLEFDVVVGFDFQVVAVVAFSPEDGAEFLDALALRGSFGFLVGHGWMIEWLVVGL